MLRPGPNKASAWALPTAALSVATAGEYAIGSFALWRRFLLRLIAGLIGGRRSSRLGRSKTTGEAWQRAAGARLGTLGLLCLGLLGLGLMDWAS